MSINKSNFEFEQIPIETKLLNNTYSHILICVTLCILSSDAVSVFKLSFIRLRCKTKFALHCEPNLKNCFVYGLLLVVSLL